MYKCKLFIFLLVFCLVLSCPVYAAEMETTSEASETETTTSGTDAESSSVFPEGVTDYSKLKPDDNGRYWIYFEFKADEFQFTSGTEKHSADLQFWVDVTDYYLQTGHAGLYAYSGAALYTSARAPSGTTPVFKCNVIVKGLYDDQYYDFTNYNMSMSEIFLFGVLFSESTQGSYMPTDCMQYIRYLPTGSTSDFWVDSANFSNYLNFEYVQDEPETSCPTPQIPVFEYEYINNNISGVVCNFRYPVDTIEHYYEVKQNEVGRSGSSHSSTFGGTSYAIATPYVYDADDTTNTYVNMTTYLDYRVTFMIGSMSYTTNWARMGEFNYSNAKNNFKVNNRWTFDTDTTNQFWQSILRLNKLPDIVSDFGVSLSADDTIVITKVEVSAYNVKKVGNRSAYLTSNVVYSHFDCITNTYSSSILPDYPTVSEDENGSVVINIDIVVPDSGTSIPSGNDDVVSPVNPSGSVVTDGSTNFFDVLGDIFNFILDIAEQLLNGILQIVRMFFSLVSEVIAMAGQAPQLFSFIFSAFPPEFTTLITLAISTVLIMRLFGR